MDPNATVRALAADITERRYASALDSANALIAWTERGGFAPDDSARAILNTALSRLPYAQDCRGALHVLCSRF